MLPFCSRIHRGKFYDAGRPVQLTPNFAPEPHVIHGFGWLSEWQLETQSEQSCVMSFRHDKYSMRKTGWPWVFKATQEFVLAEYGLTWTVTLENQSKRVMPAGMGLHPHFPLNEGSLARQGETDITLNCRSRIELGESLAPTVVDLLDGLPSNPLAGKPWSDRHIDEVYAYRSGVIQLHWVDQPWSLSIYPDPTLQHLIVYAPRDKGFICVEPVSHFPNIINAASVVTQANGGLKPLAPRERWMTETIFMLTSSDTSKQRFNAMRR